MVLQALANSVQKFQGTSLYHFDLPHFRSTPPWLTELDTELRPDGWVKLSNGEEYIIELTCPWEENFVYAHERKTAKYTNLYYSRKLTNPSTFLLVFEVGARGKISSAGRTLNSLFMGNDELVAECRRNMTVKALRGSFIVYQNRNDKNWMEENVLGDAGYKQVTKTRFVRVFTT